MRRKKITACILVAVLLIGALYIVQRLLVPKYQTGIVEGSMVEEYYKDKIGRASCRERVSSPV